MTGISAARPRTARWGSAGRATAPLGRHASPARARLTLRRLFYVARHLAF